MDSRRQLVNTGHSSPSSPPPSTCGEKTSTQSKMAKCRAASGAPPLPVPRWHALIRQPSRGLQGPLASDATRGSLRSPARPGRCSRVVHPTLSRFATATHSTSRTSGFLTCTTHRPTAGSLAPFSARAARHSTSGVPARTPVVGVLAQSPISPMSWMRAKSMSLTSPPQPT